METVRLVEFTAISQPRVDRDRGVVFNVKVLGPKSKNGRTYTESAMRKAVGLYEGAKVNLNHAENTRVTRPYDDSRFGVLFGVYYKSGEGLFAQELRFNPKHPLAEQFCWDAENVPSKFGLSHNVTARTSKVGKNLVVEEIEKVESVDVVTNPATTGGLFESEQRSDYPQTHAEFMKRLRTPHWRPPTAAPKAKVRSLTESTLRQFPKDHKSFIRALRGT